MTGKIVVISACASAGEAEIIARRLLAARLAACVSVLPGLRSFYWWQGKIEDAAECLLIIKSSEHLLDRLRAELEAAHSYQVPELLALAVLHGAPAYLEWMDRELAQ